MSVFVAQFIDDLDGDGVQEVLAVHGGDELSDPGNMGQKNIRNLFRFQIN